ncbi:MAG: stage III sporulation protein AD [Bacillota bacterium]|nr:stage III sporulation protein AD [Bacillota bacterium]
MGDFSLLSLIGIALTAALVAVFLKDSRLPVLALLVSLAAGALILLRLLPAFSTLWESFFRLGERAGMDSYHLELLLKIMAMAYLSEFGAQLCRDAGQGATALKVEMAAKLGILLLALPILGALMSSVLSLLP